MRGALVIDGDALDPRFMWSKQSKYKIETRAVECGVALRKQGVAKELVRKAVEATRAHVGDQDLTAKQWIEIAMSKVPAAERAS